MRDWPRTLRLASYRGVPFWVEYDDLSGGKRLALHEYAGGRQTVVEELGLATSAFDATIYVVGDDADIAAHNLSAAFLASGPGYLILPIDGGMLATAQNFRRSREKSRNGYIGFEVTFVPSSNEVGGSLSIGNVNVAATFNIGPVSVELSAFF
ncbi:DNA circularization N-terminal domain-containing protein [Agrobacterium sp. CNPSo 3708]|uniref:DNA circularization N-terminal domain-containing protein n=1 Tax=Agrobacterium sp. CNPSo 3708 TaxID=3028150 RepID=UPI0023638C0B|nr:DNA circularization N-terminal domain-containing protein [Agrobacterium sp. CNPSo 3708]MDD1499809.1 DNA circularization N-terminal domain-containing protein [Agrobacterium sp. CNPSo 3708]